MVEKVGWWWRILSLRGGAFTAGRKYSGSGGGDGGNPNGGGGCVGGDPYSPFPTGYGGRGEGDRAPCLTGWIATRLTLPVRPKVSEGDGARPEAERLPVGHEIEVVEVSSDGKAGDGVEPSAPLQELVVVQSSTGPSSRLGATDLVWPYPKDPRKVRFILWDK